MNLVVIYGLPSVGKFTVARELSRLTGYRLFHNHVSIDCARAVFDMSTEAFWRLVLRIRLASIEEAAREDVDLIFTFAYEHAEDVADIDAACELVENYSGRPCFVQLVCDWDVLEARVQSEDRAAMGMPTSVAEIRRLRAGFYPFSTMPGRDSLVIDNTDLAPNSVAQLITAHFQLPVK